MIASLREVAEAEPDDYFSQFCLGKALFEAGLPEDAIPPLEACLRLNPDYPVANRFLGQALQAAGRPDDAIRVWEAGIATAERTGLIQTGKEIAVFLKRLRSHL